MITNDPEKICLHCTHWNKSLNEEPCDSCFWDPDRPSFKYPNKKQEDPNKKQSNLGEKFNILYGDMFPKPIRFDPIPGCENTVAVVFSDNFIGEFTFNSPRDYKLVF